MEIKVVPGTFASAMTSTVTGAPASGVVADGTTTSTITVTVMDINQNPIAGEAVELSATGSGNVLTQPTLLTDTNGITTGTIASAMAEAKTISAMVNPGPFQVAVAQAATVTFVGSPGAVSATVSTVAASPASVVADGVQTTTITITVLDDSSNPLPGQTVQLSATGTNNVLVQPATTTDSSGVATATLASTTAETKTIFTVVNPGPSQVILSTAPSVPFVGDASNIGALNSTVVGSPATNVVADGVQTSTITVTVLDLNNNPVSGQTVLLSATGSNNTLTQPAATTDANGVAVGTIASTTAEAKGITATVNPGASQVVISQQPTISFIGDAANISTTLSAVTADPTNIQADGTSASTVTVTVKDVNDNPVPGQVVDLSLF